jgi:hypothetical protein
MIVNNRETQEGDPCFYVDEDKKIYDAIVKSIYEKDGNHYAELKVNRNGKHSTVTDVPHNTSSEVHSWNHPRPKEEVELHNSPDFYGAIPREMPHLEKGDEIEDVEEE